MSLTTKTQLSHFHDLSLDLSLSSLAYLVWLQICYAEVQLSMIDGYIQWLKKLFKCFEHFDCFINI